jgi:serine/threonine protein kinase
MGVVWEALDLERNARVALKTFHENKPFLLLHLKQEFRSLVEIRHPNLVAFYELISTGSQCFFTMECVEGVDIATYVRFGPNPTMDGQSSAHETKTLAATGLGVASPGSQADVLARPDQWDRLYQVFPQLIRGIVALHNAGKLHRDLKPSNTLVTPSGRLVLLDFGLAVDVNSIPLRWNDRKVQGTIGFIAPELYCGMMASPASDFFAVGTLLFRIITGCYPLQNRGSSSIADSAQTPEEMLRTVHGPGRALADLCLSLLQVDPAKRPSGEDILQKLGVRLEEPRFADPPVLVGREEHLQILDSALDRVRRGQTAIVYLHGQSGIGKSELCHHFLRSVEARPETVILAGRCYEQESVPYKALDSIMDGLCKYLSTLPILEIVALLPRDVAALAKVFPLLRSVPGVADPPPRMLDKLNERGLRRRAGGALRELLNRLADRKLMILYIDDLQWGDEDSAAVLLDVLHDIDSPRLLFMASYQSEYETTSACIRLLRAGSKEDQNTLLVDALRFEQARDLAFQLLGPGAREEVAQAIVRESGGNTYLLTELARGLRPLGDDPVSLEKLLEQRTASLPIACRRLLEIVAVSDRPIPQGIAFRAAQFVDRDLNALSLLQAARLVRTSGLHEDDAIQVYHHRIREAVLAHLPPNALLGHHASLARVLESTPGAEPELLAVHLAGAQEAVKAGLCYQQAADRAASALAFRHAATLYGLALTLRSVMGAERVVLERRRADALANAGLGAEAAQIYQRAAAEVGPVEALELERLAAYQFCISGRVEEGFAAFRSVLKRVKLRLPSNYRDAVLSFVLARLKLALRGLRFTERAEPELTQAERARVDTAWATGTGLGMVDLPNAAYFTTKSLLLALQAGEPYRVARSLAWEAAISGYFGESGRKRAERLFETCDSILQRNPVPHARGLLSMARSICAYSGGRWRQSRKLLGEAEAIFVNECTGVAWELATTRVFAQAALLHLGEYSVMRDQCPEIMREAKERGDLYTQVLIGTTCQASVFCALDQPERAQRSTEELLARWSRKPLDTAQFLAKLTGWYTGMYAGEYESVWKHLSAEWPHVRKAGIFRGEYNRVMALWMKASAALNMARIAAPSDEYYRIADDAVRRLKRETWPVARPLSSAMAAALALAQRNTQKGLALLEETIQEAEASDMPVILNCSRYFLGTCGGGESGRHLASSAETWMRSHGIVNPARLAQANIPICPASLGA